MTNGSWIIQVSNPSPYVRSDYVEVDLESLGVDNSLDGSSLRLVPEGSGEQRAVPFQIDQIMGSLYQKRILVFLAEGLRSTWDDYHETSAAYHLTTAVPQSGNMPKNESLAIDHYYDPCDTSLGDHPEDGFNSTWDSQRSVYGVKLRSRCLEIYISLKPHSGNKISPNYVGSITSVLVQGAPRTLNDPTNPDNFLSPFDNSQEKYWGKVRKLVIYPPPWQFEWYLEQSFLETKYNLIYSNCGPVRSTVTLQSEPFSIRFASKPPPIVDMMEINCRLYRIISMYPDRPYYMEELFILAREGYLISCRPHYVSNIHFPPNVYTELARIENIPDYFALWKHFGNLYYGYGFASNSHVRNLEFNDSEMGWRLQHDFHHRSVHFFMSNSIWDPASRQDLYHQIGHHGWYEQLYKPVESQPVFPLRLANRYMFHGSAK